jgi:hypothetical protein
MSGARLPEDQRSRLRQWRGTDGDRRRVPRLYGECEEQLRAAGRKQAR